MIIHPPGDSLAPFLRPRHCANSRSFWAQEKRHYAESTGLVIKSGPGTRSCLRSLSRRALGSELLCTPQSDRELAARGCFPPGSGDVAVGISASSLSLSDRERRKGSSEGSQTQTPMAQPESPARAALEKGARFQFGDKRVAALSWEGLPQPCPCSVSFLRGPPVLPGPASETPRPHTGSHPYHTVLGRGRPASAPRVGVGVGRGRGGERCYRGTSSQPQPVRAPVRAPQAPSPLHAALWSLHPRWRP